MSSRRQDAQRCHTTAVRQNCHIGLSLYPQWDDFPASNQCPYNKQQITCESADRIYVRRQASGTTGERGQGSHAGRSYIRYEVPVRSSWRRTGQADDARRRAIIDLAHKTRQSASATHTALSHLTQRRRTRPTDDRQKGEGGAVVY